MKEVLVPTTDVNSERGVVVSWKADTREQVAEGEPIADVETSKAVIEVLAPGTGILLHLAVEGAEVELDRPIALLFEEQAELDGYVNAQAIAAAEQPKETGVRATDKARKRAEELGVDLTALDVKGLITVKQVEAAARPTLTDLPGPLAANAGQQRVLLIGGGLGATQVIDIFRAGDTQKAVAILDDNMSLWGQDVYGVPVCGGTERIGPLFREGAFDAAMVAISTSVAARAKFRHACEELKIPLANAIDPTAKIASDAQIGSGNIICAFCHFGTGCIVGDNNFISAYNSYDHHNELGNDISTGPGCMTSGRVKIGDRCRLGTGVFIEPVLTLGEDVRVASGAIIVTHVPAHHTVKTKTVTTVVVPNRR